MKEIIIDCAKVCDKAQLHRALKEALSFPDWYGNNLDALYDCLTEMEEDTHLTLADWEQIAPWAAGFKDVFDDAAQENPCFNITFA